jgi:hypothetical protein
MKPRVWKQLIVFAIFGSLLLWITFLLTDPTKHKDFLISILQSVALIALTIVVVDLLWSMVGKDPVSHEIEQLELKLQELRESVALLNDSHRTGLRRVYATSSAAGSHDDWMKRFRTAIHQVDLMGYTMHICTKGEDFENVMTRLAVGGVHIRVLIMAEDNPELSAFINHRQIPGVTEEAVVAEIKSARDAFKALASTISRQSPNGSFSVKVVRSGLVATQIVRTDSTLTAIQYLYHAVASRTPLFEVWGEDSELFIRYRDEFEKLWELAERA